jgi:DNA-binding response OmpR family regulator
MCLSFRFVVFLDTRQMRVTRRGVPVSLTPQEYRLVHYLMHHSGRVVPQQELSEHLQAEHFQRESNAVEVLVGRVRRKLGGDFIETRRGFGYCIAEVPNP